MTEATCSHCQTRQFCASLLEPHQCLGCGKEIPPECRYDVRGTTGAALGGAAGGVAIGVVGTLVYVGAAARPR
jgi:hypothetical protein